MIELEGRVAIITGASSGIGLAVARALGNAGARTVLAARRIDRLTILASEIDPTGHRALACATDVREEADIIRLFKQSMATFGRIDLLINNAGIADHTPTEELSRARWQEVMDINLTSAFLCSREAFKVMKRQRRGRIITIGSVSARVPRPNSIAYTATKAALDALNHSLALDGRGFGITATVLHPGLIATEIDGPEPSTAPATEIMAAEDFARIVHLVATLPDEVNFLDATIFPIGMKFLGRG